MISQPAMKDIWDLEASRLVMIRLSFPRFVTTLKIGTARKVEIPPIVRVIPYNFPKCSLYHAPLII